MKYAALKSSTAKFNFLLPLSCFFLIFFTASYWANISDKVRQQEQRQLFKKQTVTYAIELEKKISHILSAHQLIETKVAEQRGKIPGIEPLIEIILRHHISISRISFSPEKITSMVYPNINASSLIGHRIRPPQAKNQNLSSPPQTFYSVPIKINQQMHVTVNKPLYDNDKFWGYISYLLNIEKIISKLQISDVSTKDHDYQLSHIGEHNKSIILASSDSLLGHQSYSVPVQVPEHNWLLEVSFNHQNFISDFNVGIIFRLLLTSAISLIIYWALLEPRRIRRQLRRTTNQLKSNQQLLNSVLDNIDEGVIICDDSGKINILNNAARRLYGIHSNVPLSINSEHFTPGNVGQQTCPVDSLFHKALYRGEEAQQEIIINHRAKQASTLKTQSKVLHDDSHHISGAMIFVKDITREKQASNAHNSRNMILEMLAHDKPIHSIFEHIISEVEASFGNINGAILLLDNPGNYFIDVIGPMLPSDLINTLTMLKIDDRVMSCGSAAHNKKMVIVEDVQTHPYWIDYKDLAWQANIRSGWSHPILSVNGELLGCFDIYSSSVYPAAPTLVLALKEAATLTAITIERHRDSQRLQKISLAVQHSPNPLLIVDSRLKIEYVNPKFCAITGYHATELIGQPHEILNSSADNSSLYQEIWTCVHQGKEWRGEVKGIKKDGSAYWAYDHVSPIRDDSGVITKFVIVQEDITENRHQIEQLDYQQNHDMLTGLINIHSFNKKIHHAIELAKTQKKQHAICVIDLDNFKLINQQFGQSAGDEFLRQVAAIFRSHLRQRDTLARVNADQFAILMKDCSLEPAKRCCIELLNLLTEHVFVWQGKKLSMTGRAGMTWIDEFSPTADKVMEQADLACYQAKEAGGNRVKIYQSEDLKSLALFGDAYWAHEIRNALLCNKFELYNLPTLSLKSSPTKLNIEILLRLRTKNNKLVLPSQFLPAALRYELAKALDYWVIEHTLMWFSANSQVLDSTESIAINLSSASFGDDSQLITIISLIEKYKDIAPHLIFEITEYTAISSLSKAYNFIIALNQYGIGFSLDNFGIEVLTFSHLKNIPIRRINIDGRLINQIIDDPVARAQVKSIAEIAQVMNIETVAKYVEDPALIPLLRQLSIDSVQGGSQGKPTPLDNLKTRHPQRDTTA